MIGEPGTPTRAFVDFYVDVVTFDNPSEPTAFLRFFVINFILIAAILSAPVLWFCS